MPASRSAPIEPYLNRMSGSFVIQSGCGSSRKNLYQVKAPPIAASTTKTPIATRSFLFHQPGFRLAAMVDLQSEGLQVLDERVLVLRRQLGAIDLALVAGVGVPGHGGVEREERLPALGGHARHEAHALRIVDVVAAVEDPGPLRGWLEEIAQARHRAVVEIRRAKPHAVERHVRVAERLAEVLEAPWVAGVERRLIHREVVRVAVEPPPVGADVLDRRHLPEELAGEVAAARAVARRAVALVDRRAADGRGRVDGIRILRRLDRQEPLLDASDGDEIDGRRRGAGAEGGALVALLHHRVVAVPVQLLALARLLEPDRREVRGRVLLGLRERAEREVEEHLRR